MASNSSSPSPAEAARLLLKQKKIAEAVALLKPWLKDHPRDRDAQEVLGTSYFLNRQFEEARGAFEQLTKDHSLYAAGWVNLGAVQNVLKDYMGASKSLKKAIQKDKKSAPAHYNLGIAQKALGMNSMAITAYREAIKLAPTMPEPYTNLGNMYIDMKNLIQAVKVLEEGLSHCPGHAKLTAVLAKARDIKDGIKKNESPLGRLVDEKELSQRQTHSVRKDLDPVDRSRERDTLREIVRTMRRLLKPAPAMIEDGLQRQLHTLNMAAVQNDPRCEAPASYDRMTETLQQLDSIHRQTAAAIQEIRQHFQSLDPSLFLSEKSTVH